LEDSNSADFDGNLDRPISVDGKAGEGEDEPIPAEADNTKTHNHP